MVFDGRDLESDAVYSQAKDAPVSTSHSRTFRKQKYLNDEIQETGTRLGPLKGKDFRKTGAEH